MLEISLLIMGVVKHNQVKKFVICVVRAIQYVPFRGLHVCQRAISHHDVFRRNRCLAAHAPPQFVAHVVVFGNRALERCQPHHTGVLVEVALEEKRRGGGGRLRQNQAQGSVIFGFSGRFLYYDCFCLEANGL